MLALSLLLALAPLPQQNPEDGRGQSLFTKEWHAGRRAALMDQVKEGVIVIRGAGTQADYREFRQDNDFWYFTGVTTPNAVLVLVPDKKEEYLLVPPASPGSEMWLGDLIDPEEAGKITGIAKCLPLGKGGDNASGFEALVADLARKHKTFYAPLAPAENWMMSRDNLEQAMTSIEHDPFDGRLSRERQFAQVLEEKLGVKVQNLSDILDGMRLVKTEAEIEALREACRISGLGHAAAMRESRPGLYEWQVGAVMTNEYYRNGAMGPGYLAIVGSGPNACILHYPEAKRQIQEGDVVLIDYAAEFNHYVSDITRSWPVSAKFTDRQREVYQAVFDAQEAAFKECKPGKTLGDVDRAARALLSERGFKGRAFPHGTSHWIGMSVHDVGSYNVTLQPGMVFTVEPGVYLPKEQLGVRIEDVVAITETGYDLLSAGIPRTVEEVEALRGAIQ
ncbi:MAG: aminopeptidase P family protein [Planctomycetota bacterium]|nr:MAG: aminopeptidase P family protein [Planctomycetota bacterium]